MTNDKIRTLYSFSLVFLDALLVVASFVFAYKLRYSVAWPGEIVNPVALSRYSAWMGILIIADITSLAFLRQYIIKRAVSRLDQITNIALGLTLGTVIAVAFVAFVFKNQDNAVAFDYPRLMILYAWIFSIIFLMIGRISHQQLRIWLRRRGFDQDRMIIVGTGETARYILQRILWSPRLGFEVVGIVDENAEDTEVLGMPVLGRAEDLPRLIEDHEIDEVLVAIPEQGHRAVVRTISYCERGRVSIKVAPDIFQSITTTASIDDLGGLPLVAVRDYTMRGYLVVAKRTLDLLGATVGLIFLSPLMLLVSVLIKLESPGPVFFIQERMGLDGKPFKMIKFRSMRADAESHGPGWTVDNDPRQTRLGILLRKIEVDELPQFINVLIGEMSLVGPRPEQPHYVEQFRGVVPRYMERHREKAGMTGWAQVNGMRGDTSIEERTQYDIWYTENWSIFLDIKIVLRTVWQTVTRQTGTA